MYLQYYILWFFAEENFNQYIIFFVIVLRYTSKSILLIHPNLILKCWYFYQFDIFDNFIVDFNHRGSIR